MNNEQIKNIVILVLVFILGMACMHIIYGEPNKQANNTSPSATPIIEKPITINKPLGVIRDTIATGTITQNPSQLDVKGNKEPIKFIIPPAKLESSDTNVVVTPAVSNIKNPQDVTVPEGGAVVKLPEQTWNIKIDREYSPFRVGVYGYPEPSLGLGYDAVTFDLDKPLGLNANLGKLSVGPVVAKSMISNNFYVGADASKSIGRVNVNLGYGWKVGTGDHTALAGVSFNFK